MMLTIPPGTAIDQMGCAGFTITDDNIVEGVEFFTVTGSGGDFVGGLNSTQVDIQDNDGKERWTTAHIDTLFPL